MAILRVVLEGVFLNWLQGSVEGAPSPYKFIIKSHGPLWPAFRMRELLEGESLSTWSKILWRGKIRISVSCSRAAFTAAWGLSTFVAAITYVDVR
jgi:hypothetical protein